jgi:hypothetical protein
MPLPSQSFGHIVTAVEWNDVVSAINSCPPSLEITVSSLDANGSIVLPTGEETDCNLDGGGGGSIDVNGISVPARAPWPMYLVVISNDTVTLKHEDTTETTPAKRLFLPGATDLVLTLGKGVTLRYKSAPIGARWVAVVAA